MTDNKKKNKPDFEDDGHVIANMNVDGMPGSVFRRHKPKSTDEFGRKPEKKDPIRLTGKEKGAIAWGVVLSYLLVALAIFGGLGLFILFSLKFWFR